MKNIRTLLVEDEERSAKAMKDMLREYCPEVELLGHADSVVSAVEKINRHRPELVFMDVNLPDGNGFDVLKRLHYKAPEVVFVTAYEEYAIKAFEQKALHYLLKPLNILELQGAVQRYVQKQEVQPLPSATARLALPSLEGFQLVDISSILYVEADGNYAIFHFSHQAPVIVSKPLHSFERTLEGSQFFRIHDKYMINLARTKKYIRGKGGQVVMENDVMLGVSVRKREDFLQRITQ